MAGKVFVVDGLDGSGKRTQGKKLCGYLKGKGYDVKLVSFPEYSSESSSLVKMYLSGKLGQDAELLNPYAISSFYAADRFIQFATGLKEFYDNGGIIICDRYVSANMIHQGAKLENVDERKAFYDWCENYEYGYLGLPKPDETFMLLVEPEISQRLMTERYNNDESKKDIHEANVGYLNKCYDTAKEVADYCKWNIVNCTDGKNIYSIDDIFGKIVSRVDALLEQK